MLLSRVSNAGVLLELDGVKLLLDGLCTAEGPYMATPAPIRDSLLASPADMLAFTHDHPDHFDRAMVEQYRKQTLRPIIGPENLPYATTFHGVAVGGVSVLPVKSRHIGKEYFHLPHVSFDIEGSKSVWFLGDAVPSQWHGIDRRCDVLIVPFAYALTESAWHMTCQLADHVVLVHMPLRENDPAQLWPQVEAVTGKDCPVKLHIPSIGETIEIL